MGSAWSATVAWLASCSSREDAPHKSFAALTVVVAVTMALVHLAQLYAWILPAGRFKNLHLGFALVLTFLGLIEALPRERVWQRRALALLALFTLVPVIYIHLAYPALVTIRAIFPNQFDTLAALALLAIALYAAGREWGWTIPGIALAALLYGHWGYLFPGELLFHGGIRLERLLAYTSIPFFQGLLGGLTELSASTIFLFLIFGGVLRVCGGIELIVAVGRAVAGNSRAGPAQVAILSSGFMGMISGSTVANVASTGAMTIPMMKRFGFRGSFAGAVEAAASMGGQLTPPVMGLAAFLIVGLTGIPYAEVMIAAVFPALIYYIYLMSAVHLRALQADLDAGRQAEEDLARLGGPQTLPEAFKLYGHLLFGIAILVWFLVRQMPPGTAALYSIFALLVLDTLKRLVLHWRRPLHALADIASMLVRSLESGARAGAQVAVIIAVIGILLEVLTVTGFAQKLSNSMLELAGGRLIPLALMAALACLVFGLGLPTPAAYILVALLGAPALVDLGVPLLAAHLFVFYFANVSALTPPVAVAALVAANIARAPFLETAITSLRLGLPAFLLPFLFLTHPEILGLGADLLTRLVAVGFALLGVIALNLAMEGFALARLALWERLLLLPAAFGLLFPGLGPSTVGTLLLAALLGRQAYNLRLARRAA